MREGHINLYSDTQSRPSLAMRQAMLDAPIGDEQKGLDESVNQLCRRVADLLGMEDAVFLPSGTMCNEIALLVHCKPGDEIYTDKSSHILNFEAGGPAALAGAIIYPVAGAHGIFSAETLSNTIRIPNRYSPTPALVSIEQTANLGGGRVWPLETIREVSAVAKSRGLLLHMDGARLMNAVVASGVSATEYCAGFDSAWIDLSKGLGCPFGGVLAGSKAFIAEAWRWKQRIGGAMRQAGMMAAAGLYALDHNLEQLHQDHQNAKKLAEHIATHPNIALDPAAVETNIVLFDLVGTDATGAALVAKLENDGINIGAFGAQRLRAVTHLDVSEADVEESAEKIIQAVTTLCAAS